MHALGLDRPIRVRGGRRLGALHAALTLATAVGLAGCATSQLDGPVKLKTGSEGGPCALAAVGGILIADSENGLAFKGGGGRIPVVFPYGYTARRVGGVVFLIEPSGRVVGREGDTVRGGGAFGGGRVFIQCELVVVPQAAPTA